MTASATVVIDHPTGLHARPAVALTRLAKTFDSTVAVRPMPDGKPVDAKSIVKVMALRCRVGTEIEITAEGPDAAAAVDALRGLVERRFDEGG